MITSQFHFCNLPGKARAGYDGSGNYDGVRIPGAGYAHLSKLVLEVEDVSPDGTAEVVIVSHPNFTMPAHLSAGPIRFKKDEMAGARYTVPAGMIEPTKENA